jgi:MFS family permease
MNASTTLLVTCSTVFLAQLGMSIYLPALPQIARDLSADASQVSWGLAVYLIGMALPMLFWGSLGQRVGRKPVLLAALGLYGLGNLALPLGQTLESFLFLRLVQGIGASGISVMARVLIRDSFRGDLLAKALSWISISFVVALGIGQYLGSIIQVALGWPAIFYLLGGVSLLMAMVVARITFPALVEDNAQSSAWPSYWRILRDRAFLLPALTGGLGYGVIIAFNTAAPLILQGLFNWSAVEYGLLGWPISAAYFLGALGVNVFVLRTGQRWLMVAGVGLVLAGSAGMLLGSIAGSFSGAAVLVALLLCGVRPIIELPDQPVPGQRRFAGRRCLCDGVERFHSSADGRRHRRDRQPDRESAGMATFSVLHLAGLGRDALRDARAQPSNRLERVAEDLLDLALIRRPWIGQPAGVLQGIAGE